MLNVFLIEGNLTKDAEIKELKPNDHGTAETVVRFSIANSIYINKSKEATSFFNVEWWGPKAVALAKFLLKGRRITVEGEMREDRWEGEGGVKRSAYKVKAHDVHLPPRAAPATESGPPTSESAAQVYEDDIRF